MPDGARVALRGSLAGARVAVRGALDGARVADRGLGAAFTDGRGALRWTLLERGEAKLMSDGPPRTSGPDCEREGALIARLRLGASVRIMGRELIERGLALGELIERGRGDAERLPDDRGAAERLIDRGAAERLLIDRDGAERLLIRAERLGAERPPPREAADRLPPLERDWAAASGTAKASDKAAIIAAKVEVHARLDRAADIVHLPSSRADLACGAKPRGP